MKRNLIIFLLLCSIFRISADIKYDERYDRIYSTPVFSYQYGIDREKQEEYQKLFGQVVALIFGSPGLDLRKMEKQISSFLGAMNSDVAQRLHKDLLKDGFYPYMPIFFLIHIFPKEMVGEWNKIPKETQNLVSQVGMMVGSLWNNGVYGKFAHEQICFYLKNLDTPASKNFLEAITAKA